MDSNDQIKLLEKVIDSIVRDVLNEDKSKRGDDNVEKSQAYKRQYKAVENFLKKHINFLLFKP